MAVSLKKVDMSGIVPFDAEEYAIEAAEHAIECFKWMFGEDWREEAAVRFGFDFGDEEEW